MEMALVMVPVLALALEMALVMAPAMAPGLVLA